MKFITSDSHYGHKNICRAISNWSDKDITARDFENLEEMNDKIVFAINSVVGKDDILYHLGDWSFGGIDNVKIFRDRIICENIHLILGNHDEHIKKNRVLKDGTKLQDLFASVQSDLIINLGNDGHQAVLYHYNIFSWQDIHKGVFHLHGHYHNSLPDKGIRCMDVGVDTRKDLMPYSEIEIINHLQSRPSVNPESRTNEKFIK